MNKLPEGYIKQFEKIQLELDKLKEMVAETIEVWREIAKDDK